MNVNSSTISDLESLISERICIKIENWNLYLGDAGLSRKLALECISNLGKGYQAAAEMSLESLMVKIGGGNYELPLSRFINISQIKDLEDILREFV
tara:strand:+ start:210 stop:497 length:288 start_codon:yes stop_codon:yes gene_type:complete